ncbi:MAG: metal-dependent transcriptional regulator [Acutalibacteraceae bacterium]
MHIQESGEMYLETILILLKKQNQVRSVDVAEYMGFSKPSVSRAVGLLRNGGFLTVDSKGFISLTKIGLDTAEKIYERHTLLSEFLERIGVSEKTAAEDACKMEHIISDETFEAIKKHASGKFKK